MCKLVGIKYYEIVRYDLQNRASSAMMIFLPCTSWLQLQQHVGGNLDVDSMLDDMAREHGEVVALKACDVLGGRGGIGENCRNNVQ